MTQRGRRRRAGALGEDGFFELGRELDVGRAELADDALAVAEESPLFIKLHQHDDLVALQEHQVLCALGNAVLDGNAAPDAALGREARPPRQVGRVHRRA